MDYASLLVLVTFAAAMLAAWWEPLAGWAGVQWEDLCGWGASIGLWWYRWAMRHRSYTLVELTGDSPLPPSPPIPFSERERWIDFHSRMPAPPLTPSPLTLGQWADQVLGRAGRRCPEACIGEASSRFCLRCGWPL